MYASLSEKLALGPRWLLPGVLAAFEIPALLFLHTGGRIGFRRARARDVGAGDSCFVNGLRACEVGAAIKIAG